MKIFNKKKKKLNLFEDINFVINGINGIPITIIFI